MLVLKTVGRPGHKVGHAVRVSVGHESDVAQRSITTQPGQCLAGFIKSDPHLSERSTTADRHVWADG